MCDLRFGANAGCACGRLASSRKSTCRWSQPGPRPSSCPRPGPALISARPCGNPASGAAYRAHGHGFHPGPARREPCPGAEPAIRQVGTWCCPGPPPKRPDRRPANLSRKHVVLSFRRGRSVPPRAGCRGPAPQSDHISHLSLGQRQNAPENLVHATRRPERGPQTAMCVARRGHDHGSPTPETVRTDECAT